MGGRSPVLAARRAHHVPALALLEAALGAIILAAGLAVALTSAGSACATEDPSPPPHGLAQGEQDLSTFEHVQRDDEC